MSDGKLDQEAEVSYSITLKVLDDFLGDFGLERNNGGSSIDFVGSLPAIQETKSENVNMSLIGAIPSLANTIAATQIYEARGGHPQSIAIDLQRSHSYLDPDMGTTPTINGQEITLDLIAGNPFLGGIYETADKRHVVPSAVYVDLVYQWSTFLRCAPNHDDVAAAILSWKAKDLESAAELAGLPFALIQSEESWEATEQGKLMGNLPIVPVRKVTSSPPKLLPLNPSRPLEGLKVLCVTHAIAGPSSGRTLSEYGASVLQIMYTHGFEHPIVYTYANLGCASSRLDFNKDGDHSHMWKLVRDADVWIDSYRDGALRKFGFTDENLHDCNSGPWSSKPGFDMQGSASSGMTALCGGALNTPAWPSGQVINDYTTGYYGALAIQATILRRMKEGGGYILSPSLTGTAMSITKQFKTFIYPELQHNTAAKLPPKEVKGNTGMGVLKTLRPLPSLSRTPLEYSHVLLSVMGCALPIFPGCEMSHDIEKVQANKKEELLQSWQSSTKKRVANLKRISASGDRLEAHI